MGVEVKWKSEVRAELLVNCVQQWLGQVKISCDLSFVCGALLAREGRIDLGKGFMVRMEVLWFLWNQRK